MKISYHGHSAIQIEVGGKRLFIDPFITGNSQSDLDPRQVKVDVILLTHGHNDHVGDTIEIAKREDALVVAPFELAVYLENQGLRTHPMNIGGAFNFDFGKVRYTKAFHGSSYTDESGITHYMGMPGGIILEAGEKTLYHAGDTALFSDMKMIGELFDIDLALLPIGDNFTMGPKDAKIASEWLRAKQVVPMHYNTFPVIEQDPVAFAKSLEKSKGIPLKAGEQISI